MKIATTVVYASNQREALDQVVAYEQAGLDIYWVPEAYGFDAPTTLGYLAAKTSRIELGSAIMNVYSRTPSCIAQTAAGLDFVTGGRAILGLGASGPQVIEGFHGIPYAKPIARTKEVIDLVRRALKREVLTSDGIVKLPLPAGQGTGLAKPLKLLTHPVRPAVPCFVAALADKSVESTAANADGWIPIFYSPEKAKAVWGDALAAGKAKRSDALGPLDIVAGGMVVIGDDVKKYLELARPQLALYIGGMGARGKNFYYDVACHYGYEEQAKQIQDLYLSGKKAEAEALVPLEMLEQTNLVGPESYVKERIAAYRESGVTILNVGFVTPDAVQIIEKLKTWTA
ncbi:MAG: LLM class F420-dependent oxidoreductase [Polyangiales bacterium]|nr:LLM class F420-dependent oxidoreductase [Myxococcales bacterium]MCB9660069.1 LLM class F420-dependent oxidoreductase [Sandaracinaceae bacterium]